MRPSMRPAALTSRVASPFLRGAFALGVFVLAARDAGATDPAMVRVLLHRRGDDATPVTYVDIAVQGTEAPIRLLRRVEGTCAVSTTDPAPVLVRVECGPDVRFEVARVRGEVVVRRSAPAESDAGDPSGWMVIARAVLPPNTDVLYADRNGQRAPGGD